MFLILPKLPVVLFYLFSARVYQNTYYRHIMHIHARFHKMIAFSLPWTIIGRNEGDYPVPGRERRSRLIDIIRLRRFAALDELVQNSVYPNQQSVGISMPSRSREQLVALMVCCARRTPPHCRI